MLLPQGRQEAVTQDESKWHSLSELLQDECRSRLELIHEMQRSFQDRESYLSRALQQREAYLQRLHTVKIEETCRIADEQLAIMRSQYAAQAHSWSQERSRLQRELDTALDTAHRMMGADQPAPPPRFSNTPPEPPHRR